MDLPEKDQELIHREIFGTRPPAQARFYWHAAVNQAESEALGYPCYDDKVYVQIRIPDSHDFMSRPATDADQSLFADAYAHFCRVRDWRQHGLDLLPQVPLSKLATLRDLKIFTIEQLAEYAKELPERVQDVQELAKRFIRFYRQAEKPRLRLVDGKLTEVA